MRVHVLRAFRDALGKLLEADCPRTVGGAGVAATLTDISEQQVRGCDLVSIRDRVLVALQPGGCDRPLRGGKRVGDAPIGECEPRFKNEAIRLHRPSLTYARPADLETGGKLAAGGLSAEDIREITQFPMKNIRAALKHGDGGKLKSRAVRP